MLSIQYLNYSELDSTMDEAWRLVISDAIEEQACISAEAQRAGRGQRAKSWASPANAGIYLSLVHRFSNPREALARLTEEMCTISAADAVLDAILRQEDIQKLNGLTKNFHIKPINDIYYENSKLAGILIESREWQDKLVLVTGIGINLCKAEYRLKEERSEMPKAQPISLEEILASKGLRDWDSDYFKQKLIEDIARQITRTYENLLKAYTL